MNIDILKSNYGNYLFYDADFRIVMESYLTNIAKDPGTQQYDITPDMAFKYNGSLTKLLTVIGVAKDYHWVVMRLNNLSSAVCELSSIKTLTIPSQAVLEHVRVNYLTKRM